MTTNWIPDELAYAGPEHLDPDFVARYDRKQGYPTAAEDIEILQGLGVRSVLDLAAGTGQFAIPASAAFPTVTAVDVSPAMRNHLTDKAPALTVMAGGFLTYQHVGPPVDAVYTRNALHQLPDFFKAAALQRIAGWLRPGGVLRVRDLIYDFAPDQAEAVFAAWFAGAANDPAVGYTAADYAEHIRTEFSTYRWLFEPMLTATGFEIVDVAYSGAAFGAYTCVKI